MLLLYRKMYWAGKHNWNQTLADIDCLILVKHWINVV